MFYEIEDLSDEAYEAIRKMPDRTKKQLLDDLYWGTPDDEETETPWSSPPKNQ